MSFLSSLMCRPWGIRLKRDRNGVCINPKDIFQSRYRAEHYNVANVTASAIGDCGEAHVDYEEGGEVDFTKEDLKELLEAYGKKLFK
jgi:hypothetical protein